MDEGHKHGPYMSQNMREYYNDSRNFLVNPDFYLFKGDFRLVTGMGAGLDLTGNQ